MPRRLLKPEHADRVIAGVFGAWFLYEAVLLGLIYLDDTDSITPFFDWLWPWAFAAAGMLGLAYAFRPESKHLAAWSGGLMIASLLSRAFSLIAQYIAHVGPLSLPRTLLGAGVWAMLGYSVGVIWRRLLAPMSTARRHR